jgi:hypothetical protein
MLGAALKLIAKHPAVRGAPRQIPNAKSPNAK